MKDKLCMHARWKKQCPDCNPLGIRDHTSIKKESRGFYCNAKKEDLIIALNALKDNAELTIDMSEKWQADHVIEAYKDDIKLAERLISEIIKSDT